MSINVADSIAYKFGDRGGGVISLRFRDGERRDTRGDIIALGFSTTSSDAVLLRVSSTSSGDFLRVELVSLLPASSGAARLRPVADPSGRVTMTTESSINTCITTDQPDTNSNRNPNANPSTKQHAVVSIQLNIVTCHVRIQKNSYETMLEHHRFYYFPLSLSLSRVLFLNAIPKLESLHKSCNTSPNLDLPITTSFAE